MESVLTKLKRQRETWRRKETRIRGSNRREDKEGESSVNPTGKQLVPMEEVGYNHFLGRKKNKLH